MSKYDKLILKIFFGKSENNITFLDLCNILEYHGFEMRIKGSHHIFRKEGVREKINLQKDGKFAKKYQVKQIKRIFFDNDLLEKS